jgi:predicted DNA-binding protein (MmcQ/YjbR family)
VNGLENRCEDRLALQLSSVVTREISIGGDTIRLGQLLKLAAVIMCWMRPAVLRTYCRSFPGSVETFPFGAETSVFKVAGKMFALSQLARRPLSVSVKCEPLLAQQLRAAHTAVLPGYHLNKRHWNTVIIDGSLSAQLVKDLIEDSYDLVVSKLPASQRQALGWHGR